MSQYSYSPIDPDTMSGTALATALDNMLAAQNSNNSGASRPSYAVADMLWIKTVSSTVHELYLYDGTSDILIGTFNPTAHTVSIVSSALLDISGAAAGQIKFPAAQNASSNANTMDDYEEGTFTPGVSVGGSATGITYSVQVGAYLKVGNRCFYQLNVVLSSKGGGGGAVRVTGLPFTSANVANNFAPPALNIGTVNVTEWYFGYVETNATTIVLFYLSAGTQTDVIETTINNTTGVRAGGHYQCAA